MINWQDIKGLHVITRLNEILSRWYGVETIYSDAHHKIKSCQIEKDYEFKNNLFKIQMNLPMGPEYVAQDIEQITESSTMKKDSSIFYDSCLKHVKGIIAPIFIDSEFLGSVCAYPFLPDSTTKEEKEELIQQLTEYGATKEDTRQAVERIRQLGPVEIDYLRELIELVADEIMEFHEEISKREERIKELNSELGEKYRYHTMIGKSKKMQTVYNLLEKVSTSEASVFIQGENGTGKELVAKAIHYYSPRKDNIFMAVNCSAFNDNLLDSELFGHIKGAFTGAIKDKKGLFETTNGGTLFLDEIGDTSLSMQVKFLRVLQEGTYLPVGANVPQKTDVRIIAATNRNIKEMMRSGEFREDLYYRINVINVDLPPLRDRSEDIAILIDHFLKKRCDEMGLPIKTISQKCMEKMLDYDWPGNVRELENEIERLVVLSGDNRKIAPDLLSPRVLELPSKTHNLSGQVEGEINTNGTLKEALEELERIMIAEGLHACSFNKSKLSKKLGISRASLISKVNKYNLDKRKKVVGE